MAGNSLHPSLLPLPDELILHPNAPLGVFGYIDHQHPANLAAVKTGSGSTERIVVVAHADKTATTKATQQF